MAHSTSQLEDARSASSLAKSLAPEDVRIGDYVAPLYEAYDFPSFCWCSDGALTDRQQTVRIEFVAQESGEPLKVIAACLPFVLVKSPTGKTQALDVRCVQLARLDDRYAKVAWEALKKNDKRKSKK